MTIGIEKVDPNKKDVIIEVSVYRDGDKYIIRVSNLPDFKVISIESDCSAICAEVVTERYNKPKIKIC